MNGVTAQQGGTLVNVLIALLTYHDGTQAHAAVGSFARNQNAGKQTADAAKAVKDNIAGLVLGRGADDFLELLFEVCAQVISLSRAETFKIGRASCRERGANKSD